MTRGSLVKAGLSASSLPLGEEDDPTRLTFDRWFGEWLAIYCAALEFGV